MRRWLQRLFGAVETQKDRTDDLRELREAVTELQSAYKAVEFEWTEMYEKFNTLHARLSKRAKRDGEEDQLVNGAAGPASYGKLLARGRQLYGGRQ